MGDPNEVPGFRKAQLSSHLGSELRNGRSLSNSFKLDICKKKGILGASSSGMEALKYFGAGTRYKYVTGNPWQFLLLFLYFYGFLRVSESCSLYYKLLKLPERQRAHVYYYHIPQLSVTTWDRGRKKSEARNSFRVSHVGGGRDKCLRHHLGPAEVLLCRKPGMGRDPAFEH